MTLETLGEKIEANIRDARNELRDDLHRMRDEFMQWQKDQDARLHEHEQKLADHSSQLATVHVKTGMIALLSAGLGTGVTAIGAWLLKKG